MGSNPSSHPLIAIGQCKTQPTETLDNTQEVSAGPPYFTIDPRVAQSSNKMLADTVLKFLSAFYP
jgi:hypothetical protein